METKEYIVREEEESRVYTGEGSIEHVLYEGDNIYSLEMMQYTHKNKIDVIYIDPPYNTGNTGFVYNDKFKVTGDEDRHTRWLTFMDKRLRLARELMTEDGVIFISIDDNELYHLKILCDQIFGEDNFIANLIWKKSNGKNDVKTIRVVTEYILVYTKEEDKVEFVSRPLDKTNNYTNPDNDPRGRYMTTQMFRNDGRREYEVTSPTGKKHSKGWMYTSEGFEEMDKNNEIYWGKNGNSLPRKKVYLENSKGVKLNSILDTKNVGSNQTGVSEITDVFGDRVFSYPKPTTLIREIVRLHPNKNAIVLDFFAGSGTTAHAVMELNNEDGGNRKTIMMTTNEINTSEEKDFLVEKGYIEPFTGSRRGTKKHVKWLESVNEFKETPEYKELIETDEYKDLGVARRVTRERVRKVIEGYTTPRGKEVEGLDGNNFRHYVVSV